MTTAAAISTTSPLRYPGGKTRAIKTLTQYLPKNLTGTILSPFVGGGSFELYLTGQNLTVEAYDAYQPLTNFWHWTLTNPTELAKIIKNKLPITQNKFKQCQTQIKTIPSATIEHAANYLIVNRSSYSGATMSGGYSKAAAKDRMTESIIERIKNFKNPNFHIQHAPYQNSIKPGYNLIFADPPYALDKTANKLYGNNGDMHDTFNHETFYQTITQITTPWLITYNNTNQIKQLYKNYNITEVSWTYGMNNSKKSSEIIITNYTP